MEKSLEHKLQHNSLHLGVADYLCGDTEYNIHFWKGIWSWLQKRNRRIQVPYSGTNQKMTFIASLQLGSSL